MKTYVYIDLESRTPRKTRQDLVHDGQCVSLGILTVTDYQSITLCYYERLGTWSTCCVQVLTRGIINRTTDSLFLYLYILPSGFI